MSFGTGNRPDQAKRARVLALHEQGMSRRQIADALHISRSAVSIMLNKQGVRARATTDAMREAAKARAASPEWRAAIAAGRAAYHQRRREAAP